MTVPRKQHTLTSLLNGQVLAIGGNDGTNILSSAELYNPATGTWTATGSLATNTVTAVNTVIYDPFVTATVSSDSSHTYVHLWLLDTQPQISRASYKYVLIRFKPNHEIDQLIPSTPVDVP